MPNQVYYKKDPNLADLKTNSDTVKADVATVKADLATTKGSAGTAYNRDRNSANTTTAAVYNNATYSTASGTLIFWKQVGSGKTSGGDIGTAQERILKANTSYLLNLNNTSGSNNTAVVVLRWHEI